MLLFEDLKNGSFNLDREKKSHFSTHTKHYLVQWIVNKNETHMPTLEISPFNPAMDIDHISNKNFLGVTRFLDISKCTQG